MSLEGDELDRMLDDDEFGLLEMEPEAPVLTETDRLIEAFSEVQEFVRTHDREPDTDADSIGEATLAMRLSAMRGDDAQRETLKEHDELDLLKEPEPPKTIEDVIATDHDGLLDSDGPDIHDLRHVPEKVTTMPDEISRRKPAEDFDEFRPLFTQCQADLKSGDRKLIPFRNEQQITAGRFYVLRGVLLYVAEVGERSRESGKTNARLRLIFANETESDMLLRSLAAELYKDGRRVTEPNSGAEDFVMTLDSETPIASVYVLKSLSDDPQVQSFANLHKIGSTRQDVETRVKGASKEATFLGAPVEIVQVYEVPQGVEGKIETMLHEIFAASRLDIWFEKGQLTGEEATEWFDVPMKAIDEAIDLIDAGTIADFEWDPSSASFRLASV
jgi:hypothetical protein